ncbi:cupin domain protein [Rhizoctonia solani AG-3 Rhs1AP]|uniref:Cupin domain protein n=3 Tax=Rhizoctonia solani TaxID=456999 RepID=A0A074S6N6_9AGAM|nr:cupin domain protein [Rhizoctonia solani AG-3 Rhs1AP]KEP52538.1 cupin domain protein [Rhizoctonia solani 123E]
MMDSASTERRLMNLIAHGVLMNQIWILPKMITRIPRSLFRSAVPAMASIISISRQSTPERPSYLVHAPSLLKPCHDVPDEMHTSIVTLGAQLGLHTDRWGINLESLPHGTRTSIPHAHSARDEFVYVVSGSGLVWLDGHTYDLEPGDCVGFPAGTGEAHALIKDGVPDMGWEDEYEERVKGGPLVLLVVGENGRNDRVWYPRGTHEHPNKMRQRQGWWTDAPARTQGPHSGWPLKPRIDPSRSSSIYSDPERKYGPPTSVNPKRAAFWPTTGRILHAKIMPAPCPFVPGAGSAMLSAFTGLSGRFDVTQLRLPPGLSSHYAPAALAITPNGTQAPPDAQARAQGDTLVYVLEGQGELNVWNARATLLARATGSKIQTETNAIEDGDCAAFPGGSGLAWSIKNTAPIGSKEDLDILVIEENIRGDEVVYPCADDLVDARTRVVKDGGRWWGSIERDLTGEKH